MVRSLIAQAECRNQMCELVWGMAWPGMVMQNAETGFEIVDCCSHVLAEFARYRV